MRLLQLLFVGLLLTTAVGCGGNDDDDTNANADCNFELVSVTDIDNGNFRVRLRNTSSISLYIVVNVTYSLDGVERGDKGIGLADDISAGTTVDIETVNGDLLERDVDYDCARLDVQILPVNSNTGVFCFDDQVGEDCY